MASGVQNLDSEHWVVSCKNCGRNALVAHVDRNRPESTVQPQTRVVKCEICLASHQYRTTEIFRGRVGRPDRPETKSVPRSTNTVAIMASFLAAVRLARVENLGQTPKVQGAIGDCVSLAIRIYDETVKRLK